MSKVKQVIVIRKDLKMTKGKMIAQGSHASLGVILAMMGKSPKPSGDGYDMVLSVENNSDIKEWLENIFTKVCVYVESEEELINLYNKAIDSNIPSCLITDRGLTMFNGVPTKTALAIGPFKSEEIDKITGNLKLL